MNTLLCIETATQTCSVALFRNKSLVLFIESDVENAHSKTLTVFIEQVLRTAGITPKEVDAVAVSSGPGSYTGLRIGVSAAKGFCYGLSKPLIMIPTTEIIAQACLQCKTVKDGEWIVAMIDARRMEVYHACYNTQLQLQGKIEPHIIEEQSYKELLDKNIIHVCGNGTHKLLKFALHPNAQVHTDVELSAKYMLQPALDRVKKNQFADLVYDDPLYLKEFEAKIAKPYFE